MQLLRSIGAALLLAAVAFGTVSAADDMPPASEWMPGGALLAVQISGADDVLDLALSDEMIETVAVMPGLKQKKEDGGLDQFKAIVGYFEANLGTDWENGNQDPGWWRRRRLRSIRTNRFC